MSRQRNWNSNQDRNMNGKMAGGKQKYISFAPIRISWGFNEVFKWHGRVNKPSSLRWSNYYGISIRVIETCQSNLYYFQPLVQHISILVWQATATVCCWCSHHRRSLRCIFLWCLCLKRGRPHRSFWSDAELWILHYTAVCQSVDARYFSFSSLQILCSAFQGVHHRGITFPLLHMKQFDSVSGSDTLTFAYPYPAAGIRAQRTCALCCTVLASKSRFHLVVFPERTEGVNEKCFPVARQSHICVAISAKSISISMQISVIKADFTGTRPRRCSGHRSNIDNWFNTKDLHLAW